MRVTPSSGYDIERTTPSKIVRHDISDDELDRLCEGHNSSLLAWVGVFAGGFLGALPNALAAWTTYGVSQKLTPTELSSLLIAAISACLFIGLGIIAVGASRRGGNLRKEIRKRQSKAA